MKHIVVLVNKIMVRKEVYEDKNKYQIKSNKTKVDKVAKGVKLGYHQETQILQIEKHCEDYN